MKKYKLKRGMLGMKQGETVNIQDHLTLTSYANLVNEAGNIICPLTVEMARAFEDSTWVEEIPDKPKTNWDLKKGDTIYYIAKGTGVEEAGFDDTYKSLRDYGVFFLSKKEAQYHLDKTLAIQRIKKFIHNEGMEFVPDSNNQNQLKYWICYDQHLKIVSFFPSSSHHAGDLPPIKSIEDARKVIHAKSSELKIIFNI